MGGVREGRGLSAAFKSWRPRVGHSLALCRPTCCPPLLSPTPPPAQLLDAAAKVLVGVSKGVDVTPERVAARYTEVRGSGVGGQAIGMWWACSSAPAAALQQQQCLSELPPPPALPCRSTCCCRSCWRAGCRACPPPLCTPPPQTTNCWCCPAPRRTRRAASSALPARAAPRFSLGRGPTRRAAPTARQCPCQRRRPRVAASSLRRRMQTRWVQWRSTFRQTRCRRRRREPRWRAARRCWPRRSAPRRRRPRSRARCRRTLRQCPQRPRALAPLERWS